MNADLETARQLATVVPMFTATLTVDGNPQRCPGWQRSEPGPAAVTRWQPWMALGAVMGHAYDGLDVDPRHGGGESLAALLAELGTARPRVYGRACTCSGGWHFWIAPLGIGSHDNFRPGLDLKGGRPDGTGRGFLFIPPTVRRSKTDGLLRPYAWHTVPREVPDSDQSGAALAALILASRPAAPPPQAAPVRITGSPGRRLAGILRYMANAGEGTRNHTLFRCACLLGKNGLQDAADQLAEVASAAGLDSGEIDRAIASGLRRVGAR
jgi:hypothetical protein